MTSAKRDTLQDVAQPDVNSPHYWRNRSDGRPPVATVGPPATDSAPARPGVQDLDPAQAERLHQLRRAMGLSVAEMALRLGLWGANGADNLRQMERGARPLPGTLQILLGYMEREQAAKR